MKRKRKKILKRDGDMKGNMKQHWDTDATKVLPTLPEFIKTCIIYGISENVNLKEMCPMLYREIEIEMGLPLKQPGKMRYKNGKLQ